ncbi:uncharacterized protein TNCV_4119461 [Trichonephila clavipes]|nr:uncharacterized protein TNCV_4119461 [Trichonephila clavipes]
MPNAIRSNIEAYKFCMMSRDIALHICCNVASSSFKLVECPSRPNDPSYARLETNLEIGQAKEGKCLRMVREDTGATSEGATCAWMAADKAVGCTRAFFTMWWPSRRLVCQGRPERGLHVNDISWIH